MQPEKGKSIGFIAGSLAFLIIAFSAASYAYTYSRSIEPSSFRSFSVSGQGKVVATPDIAEFSFGVITQGGNNIDGLRKENTEKVNKAIQLLKDNGVEDKDIKTQQYSIEPRQQYYTCEPSIRGSEACLPPEIVGYTIQQSVLVRVRNFDKIGTLLSGVAASGANSVSQLTFTIDDQTKLETEAKKQAIGKAKERAQEIAKAGGFSVGRLLSIDDGYSPIAYRAYDTKTLGIAGRESTPALTIEPGSQEIQVNITLRYEIR